MTTIFDFEMFLETMKNSLPLRKFVLGMNLDWRYVTFPPLPFCTLGEGQALEIPKEMDFKTTLSQMIRAIFC